LPFAGTGGGAVAPPSVARSKPVKKMAQLASTLAGSARHRRYMSAT
jgi:hypothetical protein